MKSQTQIILLFALTLVLVGLNQLSAATNWSDPTALPPGNNVPIPINTGTATQTKHSRLRVESLKSTVGDIISSKDVTAKGQITSDTDIIATGDVAGSDLSAIDSTPSIYFLDTDNKDWMIQGVNGNLEFRKNIIENSSFFDTGELAFSVYKDQVRAPKYCDLNGTNCFGSGSTTTTGFEFPFKNTSDGNSLTSLLFGANDGAGNFTAYLNTRGGVNPTYTTNGYALKERYDVGDGSYRFQTPDTGVAGVAGAPITWRDTFKILRDGKVGASQYCDLGGSNCVVPSDVANIVNNFYATNTPPLITRSIMGKVNGTTNKYWPDIILCKNGIFSGIYASQEKGSLLYVNGAINSPYIFYSAFINDGYSQHEFRVNFNKSDGSFVSDTVGGCDNMNIKSYINSGKAYYNSSGWSGGSLPKPFIWVLGTTWIVVTPNTCPDFGSNATEKRVNECYSDLGVKVADNLCPQPKPADVVSVGSGCRWGP